MPAGEANPAGPPAPEAREEPLPSIDLARTLWPPHFSAGTRVFYARRSMDAIPPGTYVLASWRGETAVCRFLEATSDGQEVVVMTRSGGSTYGRERLPAESLLGVAIRVRRNERDVDPNLYALQASQAPPRPSGGPFRRRPRSEPV